MPYGAFWLRFEEIRRIVVFLGYFWWEWLLIVSGAIFGAALFRKMRR